MVITRQFGCAGQASFVEYFVASALVVVALLTFLSWLRPGGEIRTAVDGAFNAAVGKLQEAPSP